MTDEVQTSAEEAAAVVALPEGFENRGTLPHLFWPRHYQREVFAAREHGIARFMTVWPRRGGKDHFWLNFLICEMQKRPGTYVHLFPELAMGRRIIWTELVDTGEFSFLEHFPRNLCLEDVGRKPGFNESEMTVKFNNGSIYRVMGADMPDRLRGINPIGIVFSECGYMTGLPWRIIEPILLRNKGWAGFNSTPNGEDWFYDLWAATEGDEKWFRSLQTNDTIKRDGVRFLRNVETGEYDPIPEDGGPLYELSDIEDMRRRGTAEEWIQQEIYCSFGGAMSGAYYGKQIAQARQEGRITRVPWEPRLLVSTAWDLGVADMTCIWFFQTTQNEIRLIDYVEETGEGLEHYAKLLKEKPYVYATHWAPHDIKVRELGSGKSRWEIARGLGLNFQVVPSMSLNDGINAVRAILPRCWFDKVNTDGGIKALSNYHTKRVEKLQTFASQPVHDRWSHGADAFRMLAIIADYEQDVHRRGMVTAETDFDPIAS